MVQETFCFDDFFSEDDLNLFESAVERNLPGKVQTAKEGPFAGYLIAELVDIITDSHAVDLLMRRIAPVFQYKKIYLSWLNKTILYKPWDIHSDYYLYRCPPGKMPYYTLLIPLQDVPSRTVIFDQYTESYNDFASYKKDHLPVDNPIDETFWNENLNMCWPQDRMYVTIKKTMPWQSRGQLQGFDSRYFHSSDNFHQRLSGPKCFLSANLWIDATNQTAS